MQTWMASCSLVTAATPWRFFIWPLFPFYSNAKAFAGKFSWYLNITAYQARKFGSIFTELSKLNHLLLSPFYFTVYIIDVKKNPFYVYNLLHTHDRVKSGHLSRHIHCVLSSSLLSICMANPFSLFLSCLIRMLFPKAACWWRRLFHLGLPYAYTFQNKDWLYRLGRSSFGRKFVYSDLTVTFKRRKKPYMISFSLHRKSLERKKKYGWAQTTWKEWTQSEPTW